MPHKLLSNLWSCETLNIGEEGAKMASSEALAAEKDVETIEREIQAGTAVFHYLLSSNPVTCKMKYAYVHLSSIIYSSSIMDVVSTYIYIYMISLCLHKRTRFPHALTLCDNHFPCAYNEDTYVYFCCTASDAC